MNFNGTINLTSNSTGSYSFSTSATNWVSVGSLQVSSGYGQFFYKDSMPDSPRITVSCAGLIPDSQVQNIRYAATKLKFTTSARTARAGSPTAVITVEAQANDSSRDPNFKDSVTLTTTSNSGQFSTDQVTWSSVVSLTDLYIWAVIARSVNDEAILT